MKYARSPLRCCLLLAVAGGISRVSPHETITTNLTWSREISRLVYKRCIQCHREGGSTFSLVTYEEARPWAQAIKEEVLGRRMPPWFAVKGFGRFKDDAGLTQEEIELLSEWVQGGAPKGDERLLPAVPDAAGKAAATPKSRSITLNGALTLAKPAVVTGIRPVKLEPGSQLRLMAERPDGVLEPLIWIYNYNPKFPRSYLFETPLRLPAGTKIRMSPPAAGSLALLVTSARKPAR